MKTSKRLEHGFLTILQGALVLFVVLAGFGGMQTYRLKHAQNELAGIKAAAKVLEEQNRKKEAADLKLKESKDAEYKRRIAAGDARIKRLLDSSTRSVSDFAAPRRADGTICFDSGAFAQSLGAFIHDVSQFAYEGDQARDALDIARQWTQELLRRQ